jgi:group II intron reverse transcriptase/maturase
MHRNSDTVLTKQQRIATLAKQSPQMGFTSLAYLMDLDWLQEAYRRTRKDGAVGVDGQTAAEYEQDLESNLRSLLERAKSGTYKALPVRRRYIPKASTPTESRPIGVPTLEDKILQRAVVMLLEPLYEQDFLDCSYGYRPNRSPHTALEALWHQVMAMQGGWIVEVDIQQFFDTLDHAQLRRFLQHRVRDGVLLRLIGKWLKAGVMEDGSVHFPDAGTPQGGVISPLLSNIYLHYVLDEWFESEIQPRLHGSACLIRFADDALLAFAREDDARRVMAVLPKRFAKHGLSLHPDKTRMVPFQRPPHDAVGKGTQGQRPGCFDVLGFTHFWGRSRKGHWVVKRKTASNRMSRATRKISYWCQWNRHLPVKEQHRLLSLKLRGHFNYYGLTGNRQALANFQRQVSRIWRKWLSRRHRSRLMRWEHFQRLMERYPLPPPRVVHSVYARAANS